MDPWAYEPQFLPDKRNRVRRGVSGRQRKRSERHARNAAIPLITGFGMFATRCGHFICCCAPTDCMTIRIHKFWTDWMRPTIPCVKWRRKWTGFEARVERGGIVVSKIGEGQLPDPRGEFHALATDLTASGNPSHPFFQEIPCGRIGHARTLDQSDLAKIGGVRQTSGKSLVARTTPGETRARNPGQYVDGTKSRQHSGQPHCRAGGVRWQCAAGKWRYPDSRPAKRRAL